MALPFAGNPLSCSDEIREDEAEIQRLRSQGNALFLPFFKLDTPITDAGDLFWIPAPVIQSVVPDLAASVLLGIADDGSPRFAIDIGEELETWQQIIPYRFENVRSVAARLSDYRASIVAQARSTLKWLSDHRFCSRCRSGNVVSFGGYRLQCPNEACGMLQFPRIDPVVIIMVTSHDNRKCLLGRSHGYPDRIISPLAGFMEPGEAIEDTVRRELSEEVGVKCTDIRFWGNQPWPFPSSLMLACFATAMTDEIVVNHAELEFADWFTRVQLERIYSGAESKLIFPESISISYHMMQAWIRQ